MTHSEAPISITVKSAAGSLVTVRASNAEELDQTIAMTLASLASATEELEKAVRHYSPWNGVDIFFLSRCVLTFMASCIPFQP